MKKEIKITVSGVNGSGKSHIIWMLNEFLKSKGVETIIEPCMDYDSLEEHLLNITSFIVKNKNSVSSMTTEDVYQKLIENTNFISEEIVKKSVVVFNETH